MQQLQESHKLKTIAITEQNYQKLKSLGSMGDSFDSVISKLLEQEKRN